MCLLVDTRLPYATAHGWHYVAPTFSRCSLFGLLASKVLSAARPNSAMWPSTRLGQCGTSSWHLLSDPPPARPHCLAGDDAKHNACVRVCELSRG